MAEQLLRYRFNQLGKAIENAEKLGFREGAALYPMVTMNGEECHNEWEITFEEIHRNGAMVLALRNFETYTGDDTYLSNEGVQVAVAVARFWAQRVHWSEHRGAYVCSESRAPMSMRTTSTTTGTRTTWRRGA